MAQHRPSVSSAASGLLEFQEFDDEIRTILMDVGTTLRLEMPKTSGRERIEQCELLQSKLKRAHQVMRSYNMELKEVPRGNKYHAKGKDHETKIAQLEGEVRRALTATTTRPVSQAVDMREPNGEPSAREMTTAALALQEESMASTARSKAVVQNTIQIGLDTANQLEQQTDTIKGINAKVDVVESNLNRAGKQLRTLIRRMATDKLIMAMTLLLGIALLVAVGVAFLAPRIASSGDDNAVGSEAETQ